MLNIRPITDLRNNFAEISKTVHEDNHPVILTKNGYGDMVVMSLARYESLVRDAVIDAMLRESASAIVILTCAVYKAFCRGKCPNCRKLRLSGGGHCPYCGKRI